MKIIQTYYTEDNTTYTDKSFFTEAEAKKHIEENANFIKEFDTWKDKKYSYVFWNFKYIEIEENDKVQEALQNIYNLAEHIGNHTAMQIISEVVKINEALEIEILM